MKTIKPKSTVIAIWLLYTNFTLMVLHVLFRAPINIKYLNSFYHQGFIEASCHIWLLDLLFIALNLFIIYRISKGSRESEVILIFLILHGSIRAMFAPPYPFISLGYVLAVIWIVALTLLHTKKSTKWFNSKGQGGVSRI